MGTPEFAVPPLQALLGSKNFEVSAVITQEDKKIGRKQVLTPPPVKIAALKADVPVFQPPKLRGNKEVLDLLEGLDPDFIVVTAYGQILPKEILDLPRFGCVNIHGSLLPLYRGASPVEEALLHGDTETGVTFMLMEENLDSGPVLEIQRITIDSRDTAETLRIKLSELAAGLLVAVLNDYKEGAVTPLPQDDSKATHCHKISKNDGLIDLTKMSAMQISNRLRAYTPWPGCFLMIDGKKLRLLEIGIDENSPAAKKTGPGAIVELSKDSIAIGTREGLIIPSKVQLEGKNPLPIQDFLRGNRELLSKLAAHPNNKKSTT